MNNYLDCYVVTHFNKLQMNCEGDDARLIEIGSQSVQTHLESMITGTGICMF